MSENPQTPSISDDGLPDDIPLGNSEPLLVPTPLGQPFLQLKFIYPLGAVSIINPDNLGAESDFESLSDSFNESPFFENPLATNEPVAPSTSSSVRNSQPNLQTKTTKDPVNLSKKRSPQVSPQNISIQRNAATTSPLGIPSNLSLPSTSQPDIQTSVANDSPLNKPSDLQPDSSNSKSSLSDVLEPSDISSSFLEDKPVQRFIEIPSSLDNAIPAISDSTSNLANIEKSIQNETPNTQSPSQLTPREPNTSQSEVPNNQTYSQLIQRESNISNFDSSDTSLADSSSSVTPSLQGSEPNVEASASKDDSSIPHIQTKSYTSQPHHLTDIPKTTRRDISLTGNSSDIQETPDLSSSIQRQVDLSNDSKVTNDATKATEITDSVLNNNKSQTGQSLDDIEIATNCSTENIQRDTNISTDVSSFSLEDSLQRQTDQRNISNFPNETNDLVDIVNREIHPPSELESNSISNNEQSVSSTIQRKSDLLSIQDTSPQSDVINSLDIDNDAPEIQNNYINSDSSNISTSNSHLIQADFQAEGLSNLSDLQNNLLSDRTLVQPVNELSVTNGNTDTDSNKASQNVLTKESPDSIQREPNSAIDNDINIQLKQSDSNFVNESQNIQNRESQELVDITNADAHNVSNTKIENLQRSDSSLNIPSNLDITTNGSTGDFLDIQRKSDGADKNISTDNQDNQLNRFNTLQNDVSQNIENSIARDIYQENTPILNSNINTAIVSNDAVNNLVQRDIESSSGTLNDSRSYSEDVNLNRNSETNVGLDNLSDIKQSNLNVDSFDNDALISNLQDDIQRRVNSDISSLKSGENPIQKDAEILNPNTIASGSNNVDSPNYNEYLTSSNDYESSSSLESLDIDSNDTNINLSGNTDSKIEQSYYPDNTSSIASQNVQRQVDSTYDFDEDSTADTYDHVQSDSSDIDNLGSVESNYIQRDLLSSNLDVNVADTYEKPTLIHKDIVSDFSNNLSSNKINRSQDNTNNDIGNILSDIAQPSNLDNITNIGNQDIQRELDTNIVSDQVISPSSNASTSEDSVQRDLNESLQSPSSQEPSIANSIDSSIANNSLPNEQIQRSSEPNTIPSSDRNLDVQSAIDLFGINESSAASTDDFRKVSNDPSATPSQNLRQTPDSDIEFINRKLDSSDQSLESQDLQQISAVDDSSVANNNLLQSQDLLQKNNDYIDNSGINPELHQDSNNFDQVDVAPTIQTSSKLTNTETSPSLQRADDIPQTINVESEGFAQKDLVTSNNDGSNIIDGSSLEKAETNLHTNIQTSSKDVATPIQNLVQASDVESINRKSDSSVQGLESQDIQQVSSDNNLIQSQQFLQENDTSINSIDIPTDIPQTVQTKLDTVTSDSSFNKDVSSLQKSEQRSVAEISDSNLSQEISHNTLDNTSSEQIQRNPDTVLLPDQTNIPTDLSTNIQRLENDISGNTAIDSTDNIGEASKYISPAPSQNIVQTSDTSIINRKLDSSNQDLEIQDLQQISSDNNLPRPQQLLQENDTSVHTTNILTDTSQIVQPKLDNVISDSSLNQDVSGLQKSEQHSVTETFLSANIQKSQNDISSDIAIDSIDNFGETSNQPSITSQNLVQTSDTSLINRKIDNSNQDLESQNIQQRSSNTDPIQTQQLLQENNASVYAIDFPTDLDQTVQTKLDNVTPNSSLDQDIAPFQGAEQNNIPENSDDNLSQEISHNSLDKISNEQIQRNPDASVSPDQNNVAIDLSTNIQRLGNDISSHSSVDSINSTKETSKYRSVNPDLVQTSDVSIINRKLDSIDQSLESQDIQQLSSENNLIQPQQLLQENDTSIYNPDISTNPSQTIQPKLDNVTSDSSLDKDLSKFQKLEQNNITETSDNDFLQEVSHNSLDNISSEQIQRNPDADLLLDQTNISTDLSTNIQKLENDISSSTTVDTKDNIGVTSDYISSAPSQNIEQTSDTSLINRRIDNSNQDLEIQDLQKTSSDNSLTQSQQLLQGNDTPVHTTNISTDLSQTSHKLDNVISDSSLGKDVAALQKSEQLSINENSDSNLSQGISHNSLDDISSGQIQRTSDDGVSSNQTNFATDLPTNIQKSQNDISTDVPIDKIDSIKDIGETSKHPSVPAGQNLVQTPDTSLINRKTDNSKQDLESQNLQQISSINNSEITDTNSQTVQPKSNDNLLQKSSIASQDSLEKLDFSIDDSTDDILDYGYNLDQLSQQPSLQENIQTKSDDVVISQTIDTDSKETNILDQSSGLNVTPKDDINSNSQLIQAKTEGNQTLDNLDANLSTQNDVSNDISLNNVETIQAQPTKAIAPSNNQTVIQKLSDQENTDDLTLPTVLQNLGQTQSLSNFTPLNNHQFNDQINNQATVTNPSIPSILQTKSDSVAVSNAWSRSNSINDLSSTFTKVQPKTDSTSQGSSVSSQETHAGWSNIAELLANMPPTQVSSNPSTNSLNKKSVSSSDRSSLASTPKPSPSQSNQTTSSPTVIQRSLDDSADDTDLYITPTGLQRGNPNQSANRQSNTIQRKPMPSAEASLPEATVTVEPRDGSNNDANFEENLNALAQEIYVLLRQRLEIEKERQGSRYQGRLPW